MYCPRLKRDCFGACKEPGCATCPRCGREFFLETGETPGVLCCICKANWKPVTRRMYSESELIRN